MTAKRLIPIAVTAACAAGVLPAASASAATDVAQAASENWSGYVAGSSASGSSNTQFKSVSGSWVQPTAKCTTGQSYSAFWVGLGGSGQANALEQDGTEVDCSAGGSPSYFSWYELVPQAPVRVNMAIHPGDHISSKVTVDGTNVTVSLSDQTTGGSFTKTLQMSNPDVSSAEWIAEAPSSCSQGVSDCTPLSLADFGSVDFTNATATASDGHTGPISDPEWSATAVTLSPGADSSGFGGGQFVSQSSSAAATPSSLASDGSSFSVAWSAAGGSASDTSGAAGDGGDGYSSGSGYGGGDGYGYPGGGDSGGYSGGGDGGGGYSDPYGDGTGADGYGGGGYIYLPGGYVLTY